MESKREYFVQDRSRRRRLRRALPGAEEWNGLRFVSVGVLLDGNGLNM
jgi:hypothetical protein